jgi:hypothetical protein
MLLFLEGVVMAQVVLQGRRNVLRGVDPAPCSVSW